jgi:hypothetical protein
MTARLDLVGGALLAGALVVQPAARPHFDAVQAELPRLTSL